VRASHRGRRFVFLLLSFLFNFSPHEQAARNTKHIRTFSSRCLETRRRRVLLMRVSQMGRHARPATFPFFFFFSLPHRVVEDTG